MAILRDYVNNPKLAYSKFYKFGSHYKGTYFELPEGPEENFNDDAKDSLDLNWLSIEDLIRNEKHFNADQQTRIAAILNPDLHRGVIGCKNVLNSLLGSAAGAKGYAKVCMCCTKAQYSESSLAFVSCGNWRFCEKCASRKRQHYYKQYYYYFQNADENVYHLTLTLDKKIVYQTERHEAIGNVWDRLTGYVSCLLKNKVITGALIFEEMTVDQLHPEIHVNPHIHAIVTTPHEIDAATGIEDVKVHVKKVNDVQQFRNLLNYLPKAIDLSEIYMSSWTKENGREVNQNLREVMSGYRELFSGRFHTRCFGRFHNKNKNSIVISPEEYRQFRALDPEAKKKGKKKSACVSKAKKIKYDKAPIPAKKKQMLPQPINNTVEQKPKKSGLGKFLGLSALGGLGALGAYHLGRSGNNIFSGVANSVHDNVVNPAINIAEPYLQRLSPSYDKMVKDRYSAELGDKLDLGEFKGYVDYANQASPSALQGTAFSGFKPDPIADIGRNIQNSPILGGTLFAALGAPFAAGLANKSGLSKLVGSKFPGLTSGLSSSLGNAYKKVGLGPLAGLASIGDASEVASWAADKGNLSGVNADIARGVGTLGGVGASMAGASLGMRLPGPLPLKFIGSALGASILPAFNAYRKAVNNGELRHHGIDGRQGALIEYLKNALSMKQNYGNENALNAWRSQAGDLSSLAETIQDPNLKSQTLALR